MDTEVLDDLKSMHGIELGGEELEAKYQQIAYSLSPKQYETFRNLIEVLKESNPFDTIEEQDKVISEAKWLLKSGITSVRLGDTTGEIFDVSVSYSSEGEMAVTFGVEGDEISEVTFKNEDDEEYKLTGSGIIYTMAGSILLLRRDNARVEVNTIDQGREKKMSKDDARTLWEYFDSMGYIQVEGVV